MNENFCRMQFVTKKGEEKKKKEGKWIRTETGKMKEKFEDK